MKVVRGFDRASKIPTQGDIKKYNLKEKRETMPLVFSMKCNSGASTKDIQKATYNALNMTDDDGKRINPRKRDFSDLRACLLLSLIN